MRRLLVTAATALAMAAAPTIASAQRASAPAATEIQPSSEEVDGSELKGRKGFVLPLLVLVAIILALLLTQKDEKQVIPTSP